MTGTLSVNVNDLCVMLDLKKSGGRSFHVTAVRDVAVLRQIFDVFDRSVQTVAGDGRRQVGGVRRSHDEREKPPHPRH